MGREIHAYENDDGTFRIEILQPVIETKKVGKSTVCFCKESKTEIPRADIIINCYDSCDTDHTIFTFTTEMGK